jgi:hypothetical protein
LPCCLMAAAQSRTCCTASPPYHGCGCAHHSNANKMQCRANMVGQHV